MLHPASFAQRPLVPDPGFVPRLLPYPRQLCFGGIGEDEARCGGRAWATELSTQRLGSGLRLHRYWSVRGTGVPGDIAGQRRSLL